jgi:hypothetical protein
MEIREDMEAGVAARGAQVAWASIEIAAPAEQ